MIKQTDFLLRGSRTGVLLIHGLTGTPAEMRFVGKGLNRAGYTVYGMQLAGHCGDEADLLATDWRDWLKSVHDAADKMLDEVDHLFVGGLSMGALLALKLAIDRPRDVAGLTLYGTTFRYDGWTIPPIARLSFLLPYFTRLGFFRDRRFMESFPYGLKDERIRDRIAGAMLGGDSAAAGLPGNPWPSLGEFHLLSRKVRAQLGRVRAPCFVAHATNDDVASVRNAHIVQRGVRAPVEMLLLDDSYHMVTIDRERDTLIKRSSAFIARVVDAERAHDRDESDATIALAE